MPINNQDWARRIKSVEREYGIARFAFDEILKPGFLNSSDFRFREINGASTMLEGTYLIRLFAEFETGLRDYWATLRDTHPKAEDLINGIASRNRIESGLIEEVHKVRDYRNNLIHERDSVSNPVPLALARGHLCRFVSRLPAKW